MTTKHWEFRQFCFSLIGHKLDFFNFSLFPRIRIKTHNSSKNATLISTPFVFPLVLQQSRVSAAGLDGSFCFRLYTRRLSPRFSMGLHAGPHGLYAWYITMLTSSHTITSFSFRPGKRNKAFISYWCHLQCHRAPSFSFASLGFNF